MYIFTCPESLTLSELPASLLASCWRCEFKATGRPRTTTGTTSWDCIKQLISTNCELNDNRQNQGTAAFHHERCPAVELVRFEFSREGALGDRSFNFTFFYWENVCCSLHRQDLVWVILVLHENQEPLVPWNRICSNKLSLAYDFLQTI